MTTPTVPVRVLIVDDNPGQLLALERVLAGLDLEIVTVTSGRAALRELLQRSFALVLLDVHLPGIDGFEVAALMRQRPQCQNTPIIFMTAYGDDVYVERGYSLGAVDFMLTPIVPDVLRTKVSVFIELHRQAEQLRMQADRLEQRAAQLAALARQLTIAEHQERRRMAGLVHDHVQQLLAGGLMLVRNVSRTRPELTPPLDEIDAILRESMEASRSLAREISPPALRHGGLARALEETCARFEHQHGLVCTLAAPEQVPRLHDALEAFLHQAVGELLLNVVKHAHASRITITLAGVTRPAREPTLVLSVADDGIGFPCTDPATAAGSAHFGLESIRQRLELFDGRLLTGRSSAGGAEVQMELPLVASNLPADPVDASAAVPGAAAARIRTACVRLLIADDHEMIRKGLRSMLARQPQIEIIGEARDGLEAVHLATELDPDVVLMDLFMPGANGLDATREILAARPSTHVVAMSTSREEAVIHAVLEAGARGFVSKTCSYEQLIAAIESAGAPVGAVCDRD